MKTLVFNMRRVVFLAVLAVFISSGCRFGNRVENAQSDPIAGIYETQPSAIAYCATVSGNTQCQSGLGLSVPDEIGLAMTNPVYLFPDQPSIGAYQLIALPNVNYAWPVFASLDGSLQGYLPPQAEPFLNSPTCKITPSFEQSGHWTRTSGPWTSGKQNQYPLVGRIDMGFQRIIAFEQDCVAAMQQALNCYNDFSACGESTLIKNQQKQTEIRGIFNPYIEADVINIQDIPNVTAVSYEVSYQ